MAAYSRVCDSRHLQADCKEPPISAPESYARQSSMGYLYLFNAQFTPPARHDKTVRSVSCLAWRCDSALRFANSAKIVGLYHAPISHRTARKCILPLEIFLKFVRNSWNLKPHTSLRWASVVGSQHDATRICCWAPAPAAIDRCILPTGRSAANPPAAAQWDRQTDAWPLHRPGVLLYGMGVRTQGQMGSDPLWKMDEKWKSENMLKRAVFWMGWWWGDRRYADHIIIQMYYIGMHRFVVKFSKFSSPQAARGHWSS